jgi:peptidoglycan/LPS O-acetylase OafA/YrhL
VATIATRAPPTARIAGVEGLRAIAASAICVMHLCWVPATAGAHGSTGWGWSTLFIAPLNEGVPMFFVLSGFLLWRPLAAAVIEGRKLPSIRRYAQNRALRILPAYWVVLLVTALALESGRITPVGLHAVDGAIRSPGLLLQDALLVQNLRPSTLSSGITPAWSLAVEAAFYALLPLLALCSIGLVRNATARGKRLAAALAPAGLLLAVGVLGKLLATFAVPGPEDVFVATWHSVLDESFLTHADLFAFGMVVAVLRVEHQGGRFSLSRRALSIIDPVLAVLAVPFLIIGFWLIPRYVFDPAIALLCAVVLARIVLAPARSAPSWLVRVLERRLFVGVGLTSYSIFLWNYPIAVFLTRHGLLTRPDSVSRLAANMAIGIPIVLAVAAASYLLVERPALRLRRSARIVVTPARRPSQAPT